MKRVRWVVGCQAGKTILGSYLDDAADYLRTLGLNAELAENRVGPVTFFQCTFEQQDGAPRDLVDVCRHHVSAAVTKTIVDVWETEILRKHLALDYDFLGNSELAEIHGMALELAEEGRRTGSLFGTPKPLPSGTGQPDREIIGRVREYLSGSHLINVEGFVNFRLKDYVEALNGVVQNAVDAFLVEREYREFVRLLRYFVDIQEPRAGQTHVFIKPGESFEVCDDEGNTMDDQYLSSLVAELAETEVSHDDLLVSVLITLAPEQIILHCPKDRINEEGVRTVRDVFFRRVSLCSGCSQCSTLHQESTKQQER